MTNNISIEKSSDTWIIVETLPSGRKVAMRKNGAFSGFVDVKEFKTEAGARKALGLIP